MSSIRPNAQTVSDHRPTVLVVDDEAWNRTLVEAILEDDYRVVEAENGPEALELVAAETPDAILLDIMMPRMDGFEVCRRLKASRKSFFVPVVMLTALSDRESKIRGLDAGADEFLNKPIHRIELLARLRSLLEIRRLRDELDSAERIMVSMVTALEGKRSRTRDHSMRVATLAVRTAQRLGVPAAEREDIAWGALLHDIGKIGVPDAVLDRLPGERSAADIETYRQHPHHGDRLLEPLASLAGARPIVRHHHERLDGSGYPDGLAGDAFTVPIEVAAAANAYESLRIVHPDAPERWREGLLAELEAGRFRGPVVEALLKEADRRAAIPEDIDDLVPPPVPDLCGTLYVADDTAANRELYEEFLADAGHRVHTFGDGASLLEALDETPCDLVLVDVKMPGEDGGTVCRRLKDDPRFRYLPVVLVTAHEDAIGKEKALASGADDFLTIPLDRQELLARVRSLLRLRFYHGDLENHESVVLSLSGVLEAKDPYTRGHSTRVGELARRLALEMGADASFAHQMHISGLLHDIGKVAIPESILHKPGPLDAEERRILETHPVKGWEICKDLHSVAFALPQIRHHHERLDGGGYPDGLAGEEIPLGARIMGVADAFDALTSDRPYRARLGIDAALDILRQETRDGRWDPRAVEALLRLVDP